MEILGLKIGKEKEVTVEDKINGARDARTGALNMFQVAINQLDASNAVLQEIKDDSVSKVEQLKAEFEAKMAELEGHVTTVEEDMSINNKLKSKYKEFTEA